jgi:serine/threonine protein kinase
VILVRKKDTGRLYAMKIMRKDKLLRENKIKPIINERTIMEKLDHPFIVKLYWSFQSKTELFFVMDICTGGEMFFHLGKVQKFTEDQARFYFAELLEGLEFIHNLDIVYRDIKPENILVDLDGHVKIADFGLSKIIPKKERSYSFCGSPEYMCPEILMGLGHDHRADIYCIGALLYELVVGFPPHFNQDHNEIYRGIVNNEPEY